MIDVLSYGPDGTEAVHDPSTISDVLDGGGRLLWVDLTDPSDADFACIADEFSLHHLAMEDARKHGQRPKLERYPTHAFLVAYSRALSEVDVFVGPTWIVTVRAPDESGRPWPIDGVRHRFERTKGADVTVGYLLYVLLDELVDGWFGAADAIEDELEALEDRIFGDVRPAEHAIQHDLFDIRRRLLMHRRAVLPLRDVVAALLRREVAWIDNGALVLLQDVYDHVLRVVESIDTQREPRASTA